MLAIHTSDTRFIFCVHRMNPRNISSSFLIQKVSQYKQKPQTLHEYKKWTEISISLCTMKMIILLTIDNKRYIKPHFKWSYLQYSFILVWIFNVVTLSKYNISLCFCFARLHESQMGMTCWLAKKAIYFPNYILSWRGCAGPTGNSHRVESKQSIDYN